MILRIPAAACAAMLSFAIATQASAVALVHVTFSGVVSGYTAYFNPLAVASAFPLGTVVGADFVIDADGGANATGYGTVTIAGTSFALTGGGFDSGGVNSGGQTYAFAGVALDAPPIAPDTGDYQPGAVSLAFGLPVPDPFGSTIVQNPITSLTITYRSLDGHSTFNDQAKITLRSGEVTPVPEPASWVLMIAGFGAVGATLRRGRQWHLAG